jgi:1A family penicillin-binding protein
MAADLRQRYGLRRPPPPRPLRRKPRRPPFSPLRFVGRLVLAFVKLTLLFSLTALAVAMGAYYYYSRDLPNPGQIGMHRSFETTRIYARDGTTLLYELVGDAEGRRTLVSFEQIPSLLKQATIAVEDANFYENPGFDLRGIIRALWLNYRNQEVISGGSTITQQLVRAILFTPEERNEISYERKIREILLAYQVSQEYGKDQILGLYLNEVYYGAQAYGVEAAAQTYFGRHVWELRPGELTLLAGLPQSPTRINPFDNLAGARERQRVTLDLMVKAGYLQPTQAEAIFNEPLALIPPETNIVAPHFVFYVRDQLEQRYGTEQLSRGGLQVVTSIDLNWQAEAQRIVNQRIAELRPRNANNAGAIILAPDGQILAMVGSVDYYSEGGQVNVTLAPRQPGSALKPFVYTAAMQRGWTPATVIWDTPSEWRNADGVVYKPMNYDNAWHGPMRLRMALANSLNIPAVKALEHVGVENFVELMTRLGVTTFTDPSRYGLAMALGSNEVRLLELTGAYNTLRNGGHYVAPVSILKVSNSRGELIEKWGPQQGKQVLGPQGEQIAYLVTSILSDDQARRFMFGANNVMELPEGITAAAKTGTSNDFRDSWAMGYTSDATIGVWVGNNDSTPMEEVAGSNGAGLIWRDLMLSYHQGRTPEPFLRPAGVVEEPICADTGGRAGGGCPRTIVEEFVAGTAPQQPDVQFVSVRVGGDGSCLAASYTPESEVQVVQYPLYPAAFREWATRNVPQPPTEYCPPPQTLAQDIAALNPLAASDTITQTVAYINGAANGPFVLEVGSGNNPTSWQIINQSAGATTGLLGIWQTRGLAPGDYTLRLRVTTPDGVTVTTTRLVRYLPS